MIPERMAILFGSLSAATRQGGTTAMEQNNDLDRLKYESKKDEAMNLPNNRARLGFPCMLNLELVRRNYATF